jgi:hypothetical protein
MEIIILAPNVNNIAYLVIIVIFAFSAKMGCFKISTEPVKIAHIHA